MVDFGGGNSERRNEASGLRVRLARVGLRARLLISGLALAAPAAAFLAFLAFSGYREVQSNGRDRVLVAARTAANGAEEFLSLSETILTGMAADQPDELLGTDTCQTRVDHAMSMLSFYLHVSVVSADGGVRCSSREDFVPPMSVADRDWFQDLQARGGFVTSGPLEGRLSGEISLAVGAAMPSSGDFRGGVAAGLAMERLAQIVRDAVPDQAAIITITDQDFNVLARTEDFENWRGQNIGSPLLPEIASGDDWVVFRSANGGAGRTVGRVDLADRGWLIYASMNDDLLYATGLLDALVLALSGLALLVLALIVAGIGHRNLARGVSELLEGVETASTVRLIPELVAAPPELRAVARQFNETLLARARAEERFLTFFQNAPFGAGISTDDGQVIAVNLALADILGYESPADLSSAGPSALYMEPGDRERMLQKFEDAGSLKHHEVTLRRKDGTPVLMRMSGRHVRDDNGSRFELMGEDITEKRRLEEAERHRQKTEAISRLAGGVSHEINNVLTVIAGNAGVLEADLGSGHPSAEEAREITRAVERGTELTRSLLAISRRDVALPTELDVCAVLSDMELMLDRVLPETINLSSTYEAQGAVIRMSRSHFEQLVLNLVLNARDAMPEGGAVHIECTVDPGFGRQPEPRVAVVVRDEGVGIEAALLDRIFEPYFTTKPRGGGTGLGLATVQGVVAQAGGTLDVQSEPGEGTRFTARFPLVPAV